MKIVNISTFDAFSELYKQYKQQHQPKEALPSENKSPVRSFEDINRDQITQVPSLTSPSTTNELKNLILYFVGNIDDQTKKSWCSDCRECQPLIDEMVEKFQYNDQLSLAIVCVGPRDEWKRSDNPYRNHDLAINAIPTIISMKSGKRLVEEECKDANKVSHLFSNSM